MSEKVAKFKQEKVELGFWLYLMSDVVLFAMLFATFQILRHATADGPDAKEIFDLPYVLVETLLLLASSVSAGIGLAALQTKRYQLFRGLLGLTILLGIGFVAMELTEFTHLVMDGNSWQTSGFLSGYFTLVGTHGLHITIGLVWACSLLALSWKRASDENFVRKAGLFTLFWHFLDLVWIFIFTVVYLMGVM